MGRLAQYLSEHSPGKQVRYRYDPDSQKIFLYHALEEAVWNFLARNPEIVSSNPDDMQKVIGEFLAENPGAGYVGIDEAVLNYGFVPCGFIKVEVYSADQKLLGFAAVTDGGGLAYPEVIASNNDWVSLVKHLVGNDVEKPKPQAKINAPYGYILINEGAKPTIRWVKTEDSKLLPGSGIVRYRRPAEFACKGQDVLPAWADTFFLELEPLTQWDEGEPEAMALIRSSRSELISAFNEQLDKIQRAYSLHEGPIRLCMEWLELSHQIASKEDIDLGQLVARALSLPILSGSSSLLDDLFAVTEVWGQEGLNREYQNSTTEEGIRRLDERKRQMAKGREKYPELSLFGDEALTYWWRRYIQDTEDATADVAFDKAFTVVDREPDPDFIYYMVLRSTENHGPVNYIFLHEMGGVRASTLSNLGLQRNAKKRVKGAVLMLAFLTEEQDYEDIPDIINDWRAHVTRLIDVAIACGNIGGLALQHSTTGPDLFSRRDRLYCQDRGIIMSYRLPRK